MKPPARVHAGECSARRQNRARLIFTRCRNPSGKSRKIAFSALPKRSASSLGFVDCVSFAPKRFARHSLSSWPSGTSASGKLGSPIRILIQQAPCGSFLFASRPHRRLLRRRGPLRRRSLLLVLLSLARRSSLDFRDGTFSGVPAVGNGFAQRPVSLGMGSGRRYRPAPAAAVPRRGRRSGLFRMRGYRNMDGPAIGLSLQL